jgi:hypothetical protein
MEVLIKCITVIGLGIIDLWAAIPAGTALKLPSEPPAQSSQLVLYKWFAM